MQVVSSDATRKRGREIAMRSRPNPYGYDPDLPTLRGDPRLNPGRGIGINWHPSQPVRNDYSDWSEASRVIFDFSKAKILPVSTTLAGEEAMGKLSVMSIDNGFDSSVDSLLPDGKLRDDILDEIGGISSSIVVPIIMKGVKSVFCDPSKMVPNRLPTFSSCSNVNCKSYCSDNSRSAFWSSLGLSHSFGFSSSEGRALDDSCDNPICSTTKKCLLEGDELEMGGEMESDAKIIRTMSGRGTLDNPMDRSSSRSKTLGSAGNAGSAFTKSSASGGPSCSDMGFAAEYVKLRSQSIGQFAEDLTLMNSEEAGSISSSSSTADPQNPGKSASLSSSSPAHDNSKSNTAVHQDGIPSYSNLATDKAGFSPFDVEMHGSGLSDIVSSSGGSVFGLSGASTPSRVGELTGSENAPFSFSPISREILDNSSGSLSFLPIGTTQSPVSSSLTTQFSVFPIPSSTTACDVSLDALLSKEGANACETVGSILNSEPDWARLPPPSADMLFQSAALAVGMPIKGVLKSQKIPQQYPLKEETASELTENQPSVVPALPVDWSSLTFPTTNTDVSCTSCSANSQGKEEGTSSVVRLPHSLHVTAPLDVPHGGNRGSNDETELTCARARQIRSSMVSTSNNSNTNTTMNINSSNSDPTNAKAPLTRGRSQLQLSLIGLERSRRTSSQRSSTPPITTSSSSSLSNVASSTIPRSRSVNQLGSLSHSSSRSHSNSHAHSSQVDHRADRSASNLFTQIHSLPSLVALFPLPRAPTAEDVAAGHVLEVDVAAASSVEGDKHIANVGRGRRSSASVSASSRPVLHSSSENAGVASVRQTEEQRKLQKLERAKLNKRRCRAVEREYEQLLAMQFSVLSEVMQGLSAMDECARASSFPFPAVNRQNNNGNSSNMESNPFWTDRVLAALDLEAQQLEKVLGSRESVISTAARAVVHPTLSFHPVFPTPSAAALLSVASSISSTHNSTHSLPSSSLSGTSSVAPSNPNGQTSPSGAVLTSKDGSYYLGSRTLFNLSQALVRPTGILHSLLSSGRNTSSAHPAPSGTQGAVDPALAASIAPAIMDVLSSGVRVSPLVDDDPSLSDYAPGARFSRLGAADRATLSARLLSLVCAHPTVIGGPGAIMPAHFLSPYSSAPQQSNTQMDHKPARSANGGGSWEHWRLLADAGAALIHAETLLARSPQMRSSRSRRSAALSSTGSSTEGMSHDSPTPLPLVLPVVVPPSSSPMRYSHSSDGAGSPSSPTSFSAETIDLGPFSNRFPASVLAVTASTSSPPPGEIESTQKSTPSADLAALLLNYKGDSPSSGAGRREESGLLASMRALEALTGDRRAALPASFHRSTLDRLLSVKPCEVSGAAQQHMAPLAAALRSVETTLNGALLLSVTASISTPSLFPPSDSLSESSTISHLAADLARVLALSPQQRAAIAKATPLNDIRTMKSWTRRAKTCASHAETIINTLTEDMHQQYLHESGFQVDSTSSTAPRAVHLTSTTAEDADDDENPQGSGASSVSRGVQGSNFILSQLPILGSSLRERLCAWLSTQPLVQASGPGPVPASAFPAASNIVPGGGSSLCPDLMLIKFVRADPIVSTHRMGSPGALVSAGGAALVDKKRLNEAIMRLKESAGAEDLKSAFDFYDQLPVGVDIDFQLDAIFAAHLASI